MFIFPLGVPKCLSIMAALGSGGPPELQNTLEILKTPKETLENYENIVKK